MTKDTLGSNIAIEVDMDRQKKLEQEQDTVLREEVRKERGMEKKIEGLRPDGLASPVSYRFDLLPVHALMKMAEVMEEGHRTGHKDHGWTQMSVDDLLNHAIGHIVQHMQGVKDREDHLSHAMVRLMMAWEVDRMEKQREEEKEKELVREDIRRRIKGKDTTSVGAQAAAAAARVPRFDRPFAPGVIE